jgi:hypothetical protein
MLIDAGLNSSISLQWKIKRLANGTYDIENYYYKPIRAHYILDRDRVTSARKSFQWHIELESDGRYKYGVK